MNFDDDIGIDPTTLDVIESLDGPALTPEEIKKRKKNANNKSKRKVFQSGNKKGKKINPDAKPDSKLRKLVLIAVIVLSLGLVGGGTYFYLHLGNKDANVNKSYTPNDITITIGDNLPNSITDYGSFPGVDIKTCKLDLNEVDTATPADYNYYITCDTTKYKGIIHVLPEAVFDITPVLAYITVNQEIDPYSLYTSAETYTADFPDANAVKSVISSQGVKQIEFRLTNSLGQTELVNGVVFVSKSPASSTLECSKEMTNLDKKYTVNETVYFNEHNIRIDTVKTFSYFILEDELESVENKIGVNGTITYDGKSGYALLDKKNLMLRIVNYGNGGIMETSDITTTSSSKEDILKNYTTIKGYTCN